MVQKKKLQVFVSSTYTDLHEERQAAVEAILEVGHIPAGMELFSAGDESQMQVIKRWIDESDVYMLILGGRYGSVESKTQKSYIHLEYEYALKKNKPLFAVVISQEGLSKKIQLQGSGVIEQSRPDKLKNFRDFVCSKMVKFWDDLRDIKHATVTTLNGFTQREDLVGWIRGDDLSQLTIENSKLGEQVEKLTKDNIYLSEQVRQSKQRFIGLTFTEMYEFLNKSILTPGEIAFFGEHVIREINKIFEDDQPSIQHAFWALSRRFQRHPGLMENYKISRIVDRLGESGLIQESKIDGTVYFHITDIGRQYLLRLKSEKLLGEIEKYVLP